MKAFRFILACIVSVLFLPIAIFLGIIVGLMDVEEIIADLFSEVAYGSQTNKTNAD